VRQSFDGARDAAVRGDEELLASAVAGLVMATVGLVGERGGPAACSGEPICATTLRPLACRPRPS
jgi:hypothetical protein